MKLELANFRDWVPIRVYSRNTEPFVDWCYAGPTRFTQPFFEDTVEQIFRRPFSLLFRHQTSLDVLGRLCDENPGLPPTGFIFHMSRCGSTLVAQMLATLTKNIVISEAPPIDSVLRMETKNGSDRTSRLRWMISALGRPRTKNERHYFIKFDSWHTLDLELITEAFPDVPWIFLFRDPLEVLVSQMRRRGMHTVPGMINRMFADPDAPDIAPHSLPEEYCASVLGRICESAIAFADDQNALFVNYDQLPDAVTGAILAHFDISYSEEEIAEMCATARFDAKTPQMFFTPDTERKRNEASDDERRAAKRLDPLYEQLERLRRESPGTNA